MYGKLSITRFFWHLAIFRIFRVDWWVSSSHSFGLKSYWSTSHNLVIWTMVLAGYYADNARQIFYKFVFQWLFTYLYSLPIRTIKILKNIWKKYHRCKDQLGTKSKELIKYGKIKRYEHVCERIIIKVVH